jgi:hypothetical protein
MDFTGFDAEHVKVLLAQTPEMGQILFSDKVSFFKGRPFELAGPDFSHVMGQQFAHSFFEGDDGG